VHVQFRFEEHRETLQEKLRMKGADVCLADRDLTNAVSIDGLASFSGAEHDGQLPIKLCREDGYLRAEYTERHGLREVAQRVVVWLQLKFATGVLRGRRRDLAFFAAGTLLAAALALLQGPRRRVV
jgi:hypothetical protein